MVLANYLRNSRRSPESALAHRLACAVIEFLAASGGLQMTLAALSRHLAAFAPEAPPLPSDFGALRTLVEQEEGVHFRELFGRLPTTRAATGDEALQKVLEMAAEAEAGSPALPPELSALFEPVLKAAAAGPEALEECLTELRNQLLEAHPGTEDQADALIAKLRQAFESTPGEEAPDTDS